MVVDRARALKDRASGLASDALLTSGSSVAATGLAAVTSIVIARALGPVDRGVWAVVASLSAIVSTVVPLGLPYALGYALARAEPLERRSVVAAGATAAVLAATLAGAVTLGIALIAQPGDIGAGMAALAGAIATATVIHHVGQQAMLTGVGLRLYVAVQLTPVLTMLPAVVAIAIATRLSVAATATASAASTALAGVVAVMALRGRGLMGAAAPRSMWRRLRPYGSFAVMTFGTLALTQIVHRLDLLIVDGYLGERQTGLYAVAVQLGDVLLVVPAAVGAVMFRRGATDAHDHYADALRALRAATAFSLLAACVVAIGAQPLVQVLFGDAYAGSVGAARWLLPGVVVLGAQSVVSNYVASRGRPRAVLTAWMTAALFSVIADLVIVPRHGIEGAAAVSTVAYLLVLGLHVPPMRALRP